MKKLFAVMVGILAFLLTAHCAAIAGTPEPKKGDQLPEFSLTVPSEAVYRDYLGLSGSGQFKIVDIKAEVVIIEIFSMYCPHCQREAPTVNKFYEAMESNPAAKGKMKLIGLGVGNSMFEVNFFRETFKVPFPLFDDKHYAIHDELGGVRTPFFIGVKIHDNKTHEIFFTQLGGFKNAEQFLDLLLKESGLK